MRSAQRTFWLALAVFMAYCSLLVLVMGAAIDATLFPTFPLNRLGLLAASRALVGAAASLRLAFAKHLTSRRVLARELPLCCYLGGLLTYALLPDRQWLILAAGFALLPLLVPLWEYKP
jgi:hypothetical protein